MKPENLKERRVHFLYIPVIRQGFFQIVLFGLGILVSLVIGIILGIVAGFVLLPNLNGSIVNDARILSLTVIPITTCAVWNVFHSEWRHKRRMRATLHRTQRLRNVFHDDTARGRLPHRWIEFLIRDSAKSASKIGKSLRSLPPGTCVVLMPRYPDAMPYLQRTDLPFEPIDVMDTAGRALHVCNQLYDPDDTYPQSLEEVQKPGFGPRILWTGCIIFGGLIALWVLFRYLAEPLYQRKLPPLWFLGGLLLLGARLLYVSLFSEQRYWVAPQAILVRETRCMGSRLHSRRFTPMETPLIIWPYSCTAMLVDGKKTRTIHCSYVGIWLLVAAWLSQVPSPTNSETQRFMGLEDA